MEADDVDDDEVKGGKMMMLRMIMLKARTVMMLRIMMLRRGTDPMTGTIRDQLFVRAFRCANMSQKQFHAEICKQTKPTSRGNETRVARSVRACAVEMHKDMSQEQIDAKK